MKYEIKRTTQFKKDFEKTVKRGLDISELKYVIELLANGFGLPEKYCDHSLRNSKNLKNCRELHIEPDWLPVYKYSNDNMVLYLSEPEHIAIYFKKAFLYECLF